MMADPEERIHTYLKYIVKLNDPIFVIFKGTRLISIGVVVVVVIGVVFVVHAVVVVIPVVDHRNLPLQFG